MRVLHLLKTSVGATWALRQMRELVKLGVDVHVALPAGGPLIPEYEAAGVSVYPQQFDFPLREPWRFPPLARRLRALVRQVKPDVIHSHFVGTTLMMRLALGRSHPTPRVFQVPGPLHLEKSLFRRAEIASAGDSDKWIASCRWTHDRYLRSGVAQSRVFLSYYCPDASKFNRSVQGTLRQELGFGASTPIVGMIAYFYAPRKYLGQRRGIKGHEDLIDAMGFVLGKFADCWCVLIGGPYAGSGWYERKVQRYARDRCGDRVVFLGERSNIPTLLVDFNVAVTASHSENFGGTGESLLMGIPTVATAVGGIPDLVLDGRTGWLVPPGNPLALAAAILEALEDPCRAQLLAEKGRARVTEVYDQLENARSLVGIYRALVMRGRTPVPGPRIGASGHQHSAEV